MGHTPKPVEPVAPTGCKALDGSLSKETPHGYCWMVGHGVDTVFQSQQWSSMIDMLVDKILTSSNAILCFLVAMFCLGVPYVCTASCSVSSKVVISEVRMLWSQKRLDWRVLPHTALKPAASLYLVPHLCSARSVPLLCNCTWLHSGTCQISLSGSLFCPMSFPKVSRSLIDGFTQCSLYNLLDLNQSECQSLFLFSLVLLNPGETALVD